MASMFGMEMKADGQPVDLKEVQGKFKVVVSFLTVSKDENAWFAVWGKFCCILMMAISKLADY